MLSCEIVLITSTLAIDEIASSILTETLASTSEGDAPGYGVAIMNPGGVNFGSSS
ncbi:hypothetical protein SDC9_63923 [bioreactor metagenome]|uniref:Uncharacterized protein n=1 Tax=bioreactor metagenome TaxID=1076179 RepID=A0A644XP48_9ZZZZ